MISNKRIATAIAGLTSTLIDNNVRHFIKNKDLTQLAVRTDNCEIVLTRGDNSSKSTKIVGFAIGEDDNDEDDEDDEEDIDNDEGIDGVNYGKY